MKCPGCGYQNKPEAAACNLCGAVLKKAKKGGTVDTAPPAETTKRVLEVVGGAPVALEPGVELTIGRQPSCSLPIPSNRVSRLHAVIRWEGDQPILTDKGSSNGTFVGGKRVKDHPLQDGDEVEIGPFLCVYRFQAPGKKKDEKSPSDVGDLTQTLSGKDIFAGNIGENGIVEVLQSLEFNKKSGTLDVFGKEGDGWVAIVDGVPINAAANGKLEEEAVLSLLAMTQGRYTFAHEIDSLEKRIRTTITGLLLEWGRRADETFRSTRRVE